MQEATGVRSLHRRFANRPLLRRLAALGVAYVVALASVIATLGAVRADLADAAPAGIVICHTHPGQSAPGGDHRDCGNACCIGCLALLAAVPPPPMASAPAPLTSARPLALPAGRTIVPRRPTKSHRSRGPPLPV